MAQHIAAQQLVTLAYRLQPFQLVGMPGWSGQAYYDVTAKPAAGSSTTRDQMSVMLRHCWALVQQLIVKVNAPVDDQTFPSLFTALQGSDWD